MSKLAKVIILFCTILILLTTIVTIIEARFRRSQQHLLVCRQESLIDLKTKVSQADLIFTGTVLRLYKSYSRIYRAIIRVKRVLKGETSLGENSDESNNSNNRLIVDGFGNPKLCKSEIKEKDTRLFLVRQADNRQLVLNSSLIRVNLNNLQKLTALIQNVSYEKGSTIEDTACEKMFCDFGSVCKIDGQTGKPYCKCENNCKKDMFAPVCGNNNVTYSNECQLRVASCTQQVRLFVKQTGECQFRDPCSNQTCHFGAVCRSSLNGRSAECVCPEKCETDSEDEYRSSSALICGSDGKDYQGWCELKKAICTLMKNITIKYNGRCDPCEGVVCSPSQVCQLDDQRNPLCKCSSSACSTELRPVCGSNGKTYSNECLLKVEACRLQMQLRVVKQGPCSLDKLQNPCLELNCQESSGEECYIDPFGISTCVCPPICPPILKPVCGTNGLTYESECDLQRTTCLNKTEVKVAYHSACGSEDHRKCESIKCDNGGQCALNPSTGEPQCECLFSCSEEYSPVCGSDGISYNNLCQLKKEACIGKKPILVVYKGLCGGCENKICQHYSVCETDGYGVSECICPETCVSFNDTVCGSDGRTYGSECELRLASCKQKKYIKTISKGSCDLCRNIHCKYGARCEDGFCVCPTVCPDAKEPICATDSRSYANECEMRKYACETSVELSIKFYGDCQDLVPPDEVTKNRLPDRKPGESLEDLLPKTCGDVECPFGGTCTDTDVSGPKCSCDFQCESTTNQSTTNLICAEDGIFYESECQLRITSCKQQKQLQKSLTADLCKKSLVTAATNQDCKLSFYGCCPDMKTPSLGPRFAGCPDKCGCNRLGSYAMSCDPLTKQCPCRPGTGGLKCDRCEPGYWGLHLIHDGNSGCTHCACHKYGSVRDDCEQTTGRCVCKDGVLGMKCDHCAENEILTPNGCEFDITAGGKKKTCEDLNCKFGSTCKEDSRSASCTCDFDCEDSNLISVCGSDNNTYGSECQMKLFSCRYQKEILTVRLGPCPTQPTPTLLVVTPVPLPPPPPLAMTTTTVIDPSSMSTASDTSSSSNSIHGDPNFQKLSFFGRSWTQPFLKMTRLNAFARLSIELEFQPLSENGILVYNGQMPSGHGDFISLALKSGYIEFKYNLGSGPVLLKSHQKIELGKYIRVSARRYYHDGKLSVSGQEDVLGKSHGSMKNLDLGDYLYVGNVPNDEPKVYNNIGVKQGLFGCISKLKISSKYVDLRSYVVKYSKALKQLDNNETAICFCEPDCDTDKGEFVCGTDGNTYDNECSLRSAACRSPKSILVTNLGPCGDPLSVLPPPQVSSLIMLATAPDFGRSNKRHISPSTLSSSSSSSSSVPTFEALHGSRRSESVHIFSGFSYLELPRLQATNGLILEIEFQSFGNNALLLYNGQRNAQTGHSDFISLTLKSGFVEFRYDLGSGLVIIKSSRKVKSGTHVRVVAKRFLKAGRLSVSGQPDTFDTSPGSMKSLDLTDSLFVGNVPNRNKKLYKNIGVKKGLIGYVHKLKIGPTVIDLKEWPLKYSKSSFSVNLKSKALKRLKQFLKDGTSNVEKF